MRTHCRSQWKRCFTIAGGRSWRLVDPVDRRSAIHVLSGSTEEAVRNAGRFLQQGGMHAVKLEGGRERLDAIHAIIGAASRSWVISV